MLRKKNHSQHHFNTLTVSGGRTLPLLCCWKAVLMIIRTLMVTAISLSLGPVSRSSQNKMANLLTDMVWSGRAADEHSSNIKTRSFMAKDFGQDCQKQLKEEKNSIGLLEKTKFDNARELRGICFTIRKIWSSRKT